jgi:hypothetical protein
MRQASSLGAWTDQTAKQLNSGESPDIQSLHRTDQLVLEWSEVKKRVRIDGKMGIESKVVEDVKGGNKDVVREN